MDPNLQPRMADDGGTLPPASGAQKLLLPSGKELQVGPNVYPGLHASHLLPAILSRILSIVALPMKRLMKDATVL